MQYVKVEDALRGGVRRIGGNQPAIPEFAGFAQDESVATGPDAVDASGASIDWTKVITTATTAAGGVFSSIFGKSAPSTPSTPSTVGKPSAGQPSGLSKADFGISPMLLLGVLGVGALLLLKRR